MSEFLTYSVDKPIVTPSSTVPVNDRWQVAGTVTFKLKLGRNSTGIELTFPFKNALNEADAVRQAAEQLRAVAGVFLAEANQLTGQ